MENRIDLPNGCSLYWRDNEVGGRTYYSDECGISSFIWDTATTNMSTLLAAMTQEMTLLKIEKNRRERNEK